MTGGTVGEGAQKMNMEFYRNFIEVVEAGTISAASRKLLIAQPALSNQIKALEQQYNAKLFIRNSRKLELTDAGEILLKNARAILSLEDIAQKDINACVQGNKGTLHLGLSASFPDPDVTNLLTSFGRAYPDITFEIYESTADFLEEWLKNKIVEIAVVRKHGPASPQLCSVCRVTEPIMAVYLRGGRWLSEDYDEIPIQALRGVPISISKSLRRIVKSVCVEAGFEPTLKCVTTSRQAALMWGYAGEAVSLVPVHAAADYENEEYCCRPFPDKTMSVDRDLYYLRSTQLSAVAQIFINYYMDYMEKGV